MKRLTYILQWLTGALWMVSGAVKANDPRGLAYKMEEFFELWSADLTRAPDPLQTGLRAGLEGLHDVSLPLSVVLITAELLLGAALITGRAQRLAVRASFALMVLFTFLTAYAYLSGRFTNCGCFGDCLPISPLASFAKDVVLLAALFILLFRTGRLYRAGSAYPLFVLAGGLAAVQAYALLRLPPVDCLPFRKGASIPEGMRPPPGARPDSFAIRFIYEKGGRRFEFAPEELPADFSTYQYIDRVDRLVRAGNAMPPIRGLSLRGVTGTDSTEAILTAPEVWLIFALRPGAIEGKAGRLQRLQATGIPVLMAAAVEAGAMHRKLLAEGLRGLPAFSCDNTLVKTAARAPLTLYRLRNGRILEKRAL